MRPEFRLHYTTLDVKKMLSNDKSIKCLLCLVLLLLLLLALVVTEKLFISVALHPLSLNLIWLKREYWNSIPCWQMQIAVHLNMFSYYTHITYASLAIVMAVVQLCMNSTHSFINSYITIHSWCFHIYGCMLCVYGLEWIGLFWVVGEKRERVPKREKTWQVDFKHLSRRRALTGRLKAR